MTVLQITPDQITGLVICLAILWLALMSAVLMVGWWVLQLTSELVRRSPIPSGTPSQTCLTNQTGPPFEGKVLCPTCKAEDPRELGWIINQMNQLEACRDMYHAPDCVSSVTVEEKN